jgi:hypothetical protein
MSGSEATFAHNISAAGSAALQRFLIRAYVTSSAHRWLRPGGQGASLNASFRFDVGILTRVCYRDEFGTQTK